MDRDVIAVHAALEERHWWFAARRRILRRVVDALAPSPALPQGGGSMRGGRASPSPLGEGRGGGRRLLLDIGCGVGANLAAFHPDYACVGFDPSPEAVAFGREHHAGIELRVGGAAQALEAAAQADVVLLNDVIEHVADDRALLAPLVDRLRPGALLLLTVPADMRLWSPHDVALGHFRRYDPAMLARAVEGLPLDTLFVSHFNTRLYPVALAARTVARRRGKSLGEGGTDLKPAAAPVNALLRAIFEGEGDRLVRAIAGRAPPYRRGVSLLGAYRRRAS